MKTRTENEQIVERPELRQTHHDFFLKFPDPESAKQAEILINQNPDGVLEFSLPQVIVGSAKASHEDPTVEINDPTVLRVSFFGSQGEIIQTVAGKFPEVQEIRDFGGTIKYPKQS